MFWMPSSAVRILRKLWIIWKDVLGDYSTALRLVGTALEQMRQALNALPADISRLKKALEDLGDVENAAHKALNRLDQVVRGLEELTRKQADKPEIKNRSHRI